MQTTVDLVWVPNWNTHAKSSGRVVEFLDPSRIQKIILVKAVSSATPDIWVRAIHRALTDSATFTAVSEDPRDYWLQAILETSSGQHYLIELSHGLGRLTGETFHGFFKIAE